MTKTVQDMLAEARAAVPTITPQEAMKMVSDPNVVFVDLRDGTEVQANGKVKGAVHIPRGLLEFQADPASPTRASALTQDKTIITYCAAGGRAALGGKTLKDMGYKNVLNMGGFAGWKDSGGEVE
jgi:rhodanese-related sulfurtransferase